MLGHCKADMTLKATFAKKHSAPSSAGDEPLPPEATKALMLPAIS